MTPMTLSKKMLSATSLVALATTAIAATAQKYVFEFSNSGVAVAIDQHAPEYPRGSALRRQEGWVRLSYVVTPDGDAIDPIIVNSSDAGEALWHYTPIRRTFSFANIDGTVDRFEARRERQRIAVARNDVPDTS